MFRFIDVLVGDCSDVIKFTLLVVLLGGGAVSCVALASYLAHLTLLRPDQALSSFFGIMSFSGSGLIEPVRQVVEVCNWVGMAGIAAITVRAVLQYFQSAAKRSVHPSNNVVQFPTAPTGVQPTTGLGVANL